MYKPNLGRLSRIRELREQGLTIDQIAAATGYPRSSVGYYVNRHLGGKTRGQKRFDEGSVEPQIPRVIYLAEPEPRIDRIEAYLRSIEHKERP